MSLILLSFVNLASEFFLLDIVFFSFRISTSFVLSFLRVSIGLLKSSSFSLILSVFSSAFCIHIFYTSYFTSPHLLIPTYESSVGLLLLIFFPLLIAGHIFLLQVSHVLNCIPNTG